MLIKYLLDEQLKKLNAYVSKCLKKFNEKNSIISEITVFCFPMFGILKAVVKNMFSHFVIVFDEKLS